MRLRLARDTVSRGSHVIGRLWLRVGVARAAVNSGALR